MTEKKIPCLSVLKKTSLYKVLGPELRKNQLLDKNSPRGRIRKTFYKFNKLHGSLEIWLTIDPQPPF